jgi:hypothetical protein
LRSDEVEPTGNGADRSAVAATTNDSIVASVWPVRGIFGSIRGGLNSTSGGDLQEKKREREIRFILSLRKEDR